MRMHVGRWLKSLLLCVVFLTAFLIVLSQSPDGDQNIRDTPSDVLINTYMRTGSSFLGRMLGFRNDAFYVYEPLWGLVRDKYFKGNSTICNTFKPFCKKSYQLRVALRVIFQYYNCTFYDNPAANVITANINVKLSGPRWSTYKTCRKQQKTDSVCLAEMAATICAKSKHKVTKVLRVSLANLEPLLKWIPNLKIIHLFRDPRAIINSHLRTRWSPIRGESQITDAARAICNRIIDDIRDANILKKKFPDRFIILQYEDFDAPLSKLKTLYRFLNMDFTNETVQYVESPSNDVEVLDDKDNALTETNKYIGKHVRGIAGNGNHPFQYRWVLKWTTVSIIDKYCSEVYRHLGYTHFTNEQDLRNVSIPAVKGTLPYALNQH